MSETQKLWANAQIVDGSSIVGSGISLLNEAGACVGIVVVLNAEDREAMLAEVHRALTGTRIVVDIGEAIQALRASPELGEMMHELIGVPQLTEAHEQIEDLQAELSAISAAIPMRFMDPPDGGDVPLAEQVRRMSNELTSVGGTLNY
ncbi:hypothetical protein IZ6_24550 [Terrihabitans soli]|uniref:Uncharacterized protein n=1 Tax=Terrihabitans soli TaxID=708113 RepID=A0A6S6QXF8_9HYPH|nr:hypothetical protein [Terrihabitans soli]BCJ91720.1 hypothetical protein IZ6_24550 [Terrihabitans soli]